MFTVRVVIVHIFLPCFGLLTRTGLFYNLHQRALNRKERKIFQKFFCKKVRILQFV